MSTTTANKPNAAPGALAEAKKPTTLKSWIEADDFRNAVADTLPRHIHSERFVRTALGQVARQPDLQKCTIASVLECLMKLAQYGIEADGRRAHLIPFQKGKKVNGQWENYHICTLIIDYKGLAELVYRSGMVSKLHSDVVRRGDIFIYDKGELVSHVPWFLRTDHGKPSEAGEVFAVYSLVKMKDGAEKCEVLSIQEAHAVRDKSQGWVAFATGKSKSNPWDPKDPVSEGEMLKKTAFRRLSKWLPLSPEIRDAAEGDDDKTIDAEFTRLPDENQQRRITQGASVSDQLAAMMAQGASEQADLGDEGSGQRSSEESAGQQKETQAASEKAADMELSTLGVELHDGIGSLNTENDVANRLQALMAAKGKLQAGEFDFIKAKLDARLKDLKSKK